MELRVQRAIVLQLAERCPNTWGRAGIRLPEATLGNQLLCLARIRLVLETSFRPADDAVKDDTLFGVAVARAQPRLSCQLVLLPHRSLEPVQLPFRTSSGEVVTVYVEDYASLLVPEHTWRRDALREAEHRHKRARVLFLPTIGGSTSPIHMPEQLST